MCRGVKEEDEIAESHVGEIRVKGKRGMISTENWVVSAAP